MMHPVGSFSQRLIKWLHAAILIIAGLSPLQAQLERFRNYDVAEGLCHPFIYTINQDKNGFIWMGTGEGLCRFDGFEFVSFKGIDSLANDVVNVSFTDDLGDLWFGFSNGLILSWDGIGFTSYYLPENNSSAISAIAQTPWGEIFVSTNNQGCFLISPEGEIKASDEQFKGKNISSLFFTPDRLLLGTSDGLEIIPIKNKVFDFNLALVPEALAYVSIQVIKASLWEDTYLIGTEDTGLLKLSFKDQRPEIQAIAPATLLDFQNIQDVWHTTDQDLWVCTYYAGLVKLTGFKEKGSFSSISTFKKGQGFNTNFFKSLFFDRESNLWVGTYGGGVSLLAEQAFTFLGFEADLVDNNILSVAANDSLVYLGGANGFLEVEMSFPLKKQFIGIRNGLPTDRITSMCYKNSRLWLGTESNGIYTFNTKTRQIQSYFKAANSLGNSINYLLADNTNLYAATKDGIYVFDQSNGKQYHYSTSSGLPHNNIEHLYIDRNNRLLFATRSSGIFEIDEKGEVLDYFSVGNYELAFNSITQDVEGRVWVSTFGQGVFLILPDTVINFTSQNGLKSNYCYSVSTSDSNYVWVGHRMGLTRIHIRDLNIKTFDVNYGIAGDANLNAVSTDEQGKLYFGTTDGLIIYDAQRARKVAVPPKTNMLRLFISDQEVDYTKPIVLPYGAYKLRIEFVGLNYNDPGAVRYQYQLEGYDLGWLEMTDLRYSIYSRVEDGDFKFNIRSFSHDGQYDNTLVGFSLRIKPPFWKTWWFITISFVILIFGVVFVIKYRERRQKALQEYLEKSLDERTREVVEQKTEIEIKNRDITDSINYAQRIQTSILPPIKKLQQSFSGSFVFYQPRDIVSGDFYWFDKLSDDKFIMVCADSTGHGVPGAFMSMIGTTLIKDICMSGRATSPSQILFELDEQLSNILNQNVDAAQSHDGMDVMVCEIDVHNYTLRFASAMRPMIVYRNGEQMYIKGSRSSIGGQGETKEEKDFSEDSLQMNKGDLIYLFSDGYPDQFGGPMGKKFKMVRLKNLLKDIHKKPMEEQYEYVKSTFNLWKEDYPQVDDVLFMGVKF